MHYGLNKNKLGVKILIWRVPRVEINEIKIIVNANKIFWIFSIIDRSTKENRVLTLLDNRDKEIFLSLVIKNIATCYEII